jgi:NAD(P)-dependent dehydrogenase (short-subunit alcohol dehydrogenase family)
MSSQELQGKVAIVSGGAGAIGSATVRRLAEQGARVVIADLAASPMHDVAAGMRADGLDVVAHELDLSQESSIRGLIQFTADTYGRIDVLDNNAAMKGVSGDGDVMNMTSEVWDEVLGCNTRGTMLMCKYSLPIMIQGGGGSIVNISSGTSIGGEAFQTAYAVSKGAINTLTLYLATQYGSKGVRCNALLVGLVTTPANLLTMPEPIRQTMLSHKLMGRLGRPEDIAEMVSFLANDRSNWITGQLWSVDGGYYAHQPTAPQFAAIMRPAAR